VDHELAVDEHALGHAELGQRAAITLRQPEDAPCHLRDQGIAVVLISHRMPDVFTVADRIIVLRRGRMVADRKVADSSPEEVTGLINGAIDKQ
jgi:simple sugar transport system ATP-binding protein